MSNDSFRYLLYAFLRILNITIMHNLGPEMPSGCIPPVKDLHSPWQEVDHDDDEEQEGEAEMIRKM